MNWKELSKNIEKMLITVEYWSSVPEKLNAMEEDILEFLNQFVVELEKVSTNYVEVMKHYQKVCESIKGLSSTDRPEVDSDQVKAVKLKIDPLSAVAGMAVGGTFNGSFIGAESEEQCTSSISMNELYDMEGISEEPCDTYTDDLDF